MAKYEVSADEMRDAPKITLGGKAFSIPLMAPRQNRKLIPFAFKMGGYLQSSSLEEKDFDDMVSAIATGLSRAYPEITADDLMDMPMTLDEMQDALRIIFEQTGVVKKGVAGDAQGEAVAGSSQTGTA